jgi:GNAT superfamily N-acetyltransferase
MAEEYVAATEDLLAAKGEGAALLVAEAVDGAVLGFVTCFVREDDLERDRRELCIEDVVVTAASRRRGVGRALVAAACRFAAERGVRRVVVSALSANEETVAAYAAMGFRPALVTLERLLPGVEGPGR